MARKTMQKKIITTTIEGFRLENGAPVPASFVINGKVSDLEKAQKLARKSDASFMAVSLVHSAMLYTMDISKFLELAECEPCEYDADAEDETEDETEE